MATPEQQPRPQPEQGEVPVEKRPEAMSLPEQLEQDTGAQARPAAPASLTDDQGQVVAQSAQSDDDDQNQTAIEIPADPAQAKQWSQGAPESSNTWLGVYVLRKIKQAFITGRKLVIKK